MKEMAHAWNASLPAACAQQQGRRQEYRCLSPSVLLPTLPYPSLVIASRYDLETLRVGGLAGWQTVAALVWFSCVVVWALHCCIWHGLVFY